MKVELLWTVLLALVARGVTQTCLSYTERLDCHPGPFEGSDTRAECEAMGCTFCDADVPDWNVPTCFLPKSYGYQMVGEPVETQDGVRVNLQRATPISMFGSDAEEITLEAQFQSDSRLRIKITDGSDRYEVPLRIDPAEGGNSNRLYDITFSNDPVFSFKVTRRSTRTIIFDTSLGGLTFSDQFLQLTTKVPSQNLFGIGENQQYTFRQRFEKFQVYPLFANGQHPAGNSNLYGTQPYYTVLEDDGNAHSVLFVNSNAQDFVLLPSPGILYRTIGGLLDVYIFLGPTPENTVEQSTQAIGRTAIPPYWALGFQLSKYGYDTLENMQAAVDRMVQYDIPQDVQYGDIDIMDRQMDFTISEERFGGLPQYVKDLKARGVKFMTILDPVIATSEPPGTYRPYELGNEMDVWVKTADGRTVLGLMWPEGPSAYPDYSKNSTREYWITLIKEFHDLIEWDGLWIDMNEPSNFIDGMVDEGCANNKWNNPPYTPKVAGDYLPKNTLCMDHVDSVSRHYDTHSLYGWFESEQTLAGVQAARPGKRGFVLSRSTYTGSGRWTSHWLGDNFSSWAHLKESIIGMLQFNHFGLVFVGPDICGHDGNPGPELCQRWSQLGAFYPFARSHNSKDSDPQDPGYFGPEVAAAVRHALQVRYTLLPHLYTLLYDHFTQGSTVARALWHEFPMDKATIDIDTQFMWGKGLLISPAYEEGQTSLDLYFPRARWYNYYSGMEIDASGASLTVEAPMDIINVHVRGGVIIPTQGNASNTELSRINPFGLIVALDEQQEASGHLYYDDGEILEPTQSGLYYLGSFTYVDGALESTVENNGWTGMSQLRLNSIRLLGSSRLFTSVTVNQEVFPVIALASGELTVDQLDLDPTQNFKLTFE